MLKAGFKCGDEKKMGKDKQERKILNKIFWFPYSFFSSIYFSKLHVTVANQSTGPGLAPLGQGFPLGHHLLTLHGAEDHPLHRHELLPQEALAAAGAQEALGGRMPAETVIGHPLHFRVDGVVAPLTHHSVILHVAGLAHGLVVDHHVYFPS